MIMILKKKNHSQISNGMKEDDIKIKSNGNFLVIVKLNPFIKTHYSLERGFFFIASRALLS